MHQHAKDKLLSLFCTYFTTKMIRNYGDPYKSTLHSSRIEKLKIPHLFRKQPIIGMFRWCTISSLMMVSIDSRIRKEKQNEKDMAHVDPGLRQHGYWVISVQ